MKTSPSIDTIVLQQISHAGISMQNGIMTRASSRSIGAAHRIVTTDTSIFSSTNDLHDNSRFLRRLPAEQIDRFTSVSLQFPEVELSKNFHDNILNIIACLGDIQNLNVLITSESLSNKLYASRNGDFVESNTVQEWAEITILIFIHSYPIIIKRQHAFSKRKNHETQLYGMFHSLVNDYQPYIGLAFCEIDNKEYDLILPPGQGGVLVHEAIGHALEADHFYLDNSVLRNKWQKPIADGSISISDTCNSNDIISMNYDSDGSPVRNVELIKNGIIVGLLSDLNTSSRWLIPNTGNGRSQSVEHLPIPRMRNTFMHNGQTAREEIIETTKRGVGVIDIGGGQVDISSGDFVFNVMAGYLIENGVPVSLVKPFLYKGNVLDTLKKIDMLGNDLSFELASCGKHGQLLNVSYGQPTVRISNQYLGGANND